MKKMTKHSWIGFPPWIILGAVIILVPIFVFWTLQNIRKQKESMTLLLLEKGAALIRSFEAGTRTGMMGMMGMRAGGFQLQRLLMETARQPDIAYLLVTDTEGSIVAHSDPVRIGGTYGKDLALERLSRSEKVEWRQVSNQGAPDTFEVFRRFSPTRVPFRAPHGRGMHGVGPPDLPQLREDVPEKGQIIFVGLDMGTVDEAIKQDIRQGIIMALILLLIGFAGILLLFLAHAYRTTRTSLSRIKVFSDRVVEDMPIGLLTIDTDGRIASFNQRAESLLRPSAGGLIGKKATDALPPQIWSSADEAESGKRVIEREIECPVQDGKVVPLDVSVSRLEGDDGSFWGHIILFRDLTEVQNLKREVETSRRLASLGRIAAGIAHEIRNPLSSIKGFATYFKERYRDNPEDKTTAEIMVQEVDRLNRVISQLLEFARPINVEKKPSSLQSLIQHSLKTIERQAEAKGIRIITSLAPDIKEVSLDPDRINQVLLNLYLNAIEAMEKGGTLSVDLSRAGISKGVRISVSDTGVGISKENLDHIFDPYFTTRPSGTGLGLAIVHKIIESHQGEVTVESEEGKGTEVAILLPTGSGT